MMTIDLHAHVFNAAYLPLEGIARARRVPKVLAWLFARILEAIVEDEELRTTDELDAALKVFFARPPAGAAGWKASFQSGEDPITALAATVGTDVLQAHEAEINKALMELDKIEAERGLVAVDAAPKVLAADAFLEGLPAGGLRKKLARVLRRVAAVMENGIIIVEWLVLLLRRETAVAQQLCDTFPGVKLFVHHTMDLGPHYNPEYCSYQFEYRQLQRVRALTEHFKGKLLPFVAYSPFRPDGVALVKTWLERGFAGVKFYPPSGYLPIGNTVDVLKNSEHDPRDVDDRNLELFQYCEDEGIPIFAHCQPGEFQRYPGAGCLSHPNGWQRVLEQCPRLRLCLGHAGGEGWTAAQGKEDDDAMTECGALTGFIAGAVELCVKYDNVYVEFGCMETILEGDAAAANLAIRLRRYTVEHGDKFGKAIIYGSDWHMLARTPGVRAYLSTFEEMFADDDVLRPFAQDFFSGNALRFIDLPRFLARSTGHFSKTVGEYLETVVAATPLAVEDAGPLA